MDYSKKLNEMLNSELRNIKVRIKNITNEATLNLEESNKIIKKIEDVQNDFKELLKISVEEISLIANILNVEDIGVLMAYRRFLENESLIFDKDYILNLKRICESIINEFEEYKNNIIISNSKISMLKEKEQKIISLISKLNNYEIVGSDLDLFVEFFDSMGISKKEQIDIIIFITNQRLKNIDINALLDIEIENDNLGIEEEDLVQLFLEYNYNFYDIDENSRDKIKAEGNLKTIQGIFKTLEEFGVNLNTVLGNDKFIKKRSKQLTEILINSNSELVKNLFNAIHEINSTTNVGLDYLELIKTPSVFISRKNDYHSKKENSDSNTVEEEESLFGCNQDFIANIKLLKDKCDEARLTNNFQRIYRKSLSALQLPNKKVLNVIKIYELYGIPAESYLNALSGFNSSQQEDIFDIAIELDIFDYVKENMSRANLSKDDPLINNIAIVRSYGWDNEELFKTVNKNTLLGSMQSKYLRQSAIKQMANEKEFDKFDIDSKFSSEFKNIIDEAEKCIKESNNNDISLSMQELNDVNSESILKKLESYVSSENPYLYEINGIKISKIKVLRLYNTLKQNNMSIDEYPTQTNILVYIMTRNSYITDEQFDQLYNEISNIAEKEKKI